jgi:hypothetical protein
MLAINEKSATAVTFGVWIAALGSAAALAYTLNRAPHARDIVSQVEAPLATAPAPAALAAESVSESPSVLYLPTFTIVGQVRRSLPSAPAPHPASDIAKMHCTDWRGLDIGSGHVQVCQ